MIDLHCHLLPGIDDGAGDMAQALEMAACAEKETITGIIATPHYITGTFENTTRGRIDSEVELLNQALQEKGINIKVYTGCEVFISPEVPQLVNNGIIPTLNGSRYILVELPMGSMPIYTENFFYELQLLGLTPVIAHPERKKEVIGNPDLLKSYLEKGVLTQVNSGSFTGFYGDAVAKTAWKLLEKQMVHFIATDAHNNRHRAPMIIKAYEMVSKRVGKATAELLFEVNPSRVLMDEEIADVNNYSDKKQGLLSKFFGSGKKR